MKESSRPPNRNWVVIEELCEGWKAAKQLESFVDDESARELVKKVLSSFSRGISGLDSGVAPEVSQDHLADSGVDRSGNRTSQVFGRKRKMDPAREGRACCRRRLNSDFSKITSNTTDDGFSWRKYGQKAIYGAKFPRSYFRCTHKYDLGCEASRQLQRSEEDPNMFVISYMGKHTCRDPSKASADGTPRIISFGPDNDGEILDPSVALFPQTTKHGVDEEVLSNGTPHRSSSGFFVSPEMTMLRGHGDEGSSGLQSCTSSVDLGWMGDDDEFDVDDMFALDQDEFF